MHIRLRRQGCSVDLRESEAAETRDSGSAAPNLGGIRQPDSRIEKPRTQKPGSTLHYVRRACVGDCSYRPTTSLGHCV
jgi:hypothetical protein